MRLIDADVLLEELRKLSAEPAYYHTDEDFYVGICTAESLIYDQDTIELNNIIAKWNTDIKS